jgi:hypothetical protein
MCNIYAPFYLFCISVLYIKALIDLLAPKLTYLLSLTKTARDIIVGPCLLLVRLQEVTCKAKDKSAPECSPSEAGYCILLLMRVGSQTLCGSGHGLLQLPHIPLAIVLITHSV